MIEGHNVILVECPKCGNAVNINSRKCPTCGTNVKKEYEDNQNALIYGGLIVFSLCFCSFFVYAFLLDYPFTYIERVFLGIEYGGGEKINLYYATGISFVISAILYLFKIWLAAKNKFMLYFFKYLTIFSLTISSILIVGLFGKLVAFVFFEVL